MSSNRQNILLSVERWSAWSPGMADKAAWRHWAETGEWGDGPDKPDVQFVAPMLRRRLSGLSRMVMHVTADCCGGELKNAGFVFCSRYGEYERSLGMLQDLANKQPLSAAAFSMSVHNTSASLYAIHAKDTSPSMMVSSSQSTLESAIIEAWCALQEGLFQSVCLVYHDQPLPDLYGKAAESISKDIAFALLLELPDKGSIKNRLSLSWCANDSAFQPDGQTTASRNAALDVLKLVAMGAGAATNSTERLLWEWRVDAAAI